jgi:hypothetical protein
MDDENEVKPPEPIRFPFSKSQPAINPRRRAEKQEMIILGIKSKKAYRKYRKEQRRLRRIENDN